MEQIWNWEKSAFLCFFRSKISNIVLPTKYWAMWNSTDIYFPEGDNRTLLKHTHIHTMEKISDQWNQYIYIYLHFHYSISCKDAKTIHIITENHHCWFLEAEFSQERQNGYREMSVNVEGMYEKTQEEDVMCGLYVPSMNWMPRSSAYSDTSQALWCTEGSESWLPGSADGTRAFSRGADRKHRQTPKVPTNFKRTHHLSS